ncbi:MAG: DUF3536 domain-containing protein [Candidatus Saccharimonadales bacterium]
MSIGPEKSNESVASRYVGMHGHAYQPPRESADGTIYEAAEVSAEHPDHPEWRNWNDVETALAYEPVASSGSLEHMSFDLAPTLATYLERQHPEVYEKFIAAPKTLESAGEPHNVLSTPYFHAILPLLPVRDQRTLIGWGRYDTERRFGVSPTGIWLPEMAMNSQVLAEAKRAGFEWTYGFPGQLEGPVGTPTGYNVPAGESGDMTVLLETSHRPGWHNFYNNYDGSNPEGIQEGLDSWKDDMLAGQTPGDHFAQLSLKATDLEHLKGALPQRVASAAAHEAKSLGWSTPSAFMARVKDKVELPETKVVENSAGEGATGQAHTLERWTGERDGAVVVRWKYDLQAAYGQFAAGIDAVYEKNLVTLGFDQPWEMRDDYIRLVEGETTEREYFNRWDAPQNVGAEERYQTLKLLAAEYHKLAAASSCAWFFDNPTGVEPRIAVRQMRIAIEYLRTSGIEDSAAEATKIEESLLERLKLVADEKSRLSKIYRGIGVVSVANQTMPVS